jgi:hypothetical protein
VQRTPVGAADHDVSTIKKIMNRIEQQLSERLTATFKQYIRHAIKHALNEKESENDILQVIVNLQASLDYLVNFIFYSGKGGRELSMLDFITNLNLKCF